MDQGTGDVQQERERTRSAITEKIELLEERVRDTVEGARTRVKQSFDIRYHIDRRPWQMLGLSILAGYLISRMITDSTSNGSGRDYGQKRWRRQPYSSQETRFDEEPVTAASAEGAYSASPPPAHQKAWGIFDQFRDELDTLKGAAIAAVVSVVRDLLKSAASSAKDSSKSITNERRSPA